MINKLDMRSDILEVLLTEQQIKDRIKELGAQITEDYKGKELVLVGILKGVVPFYAAMAQAIDLQIQEDFMSVSSYGAGTVSSGKLIIRKDIDIDIEGKDVLILEDIFCGVVPLGAENRAWRQNTGRLAQYLSREATQVSRIFCGLEQRLK